MSRDPTRPAAQRLSLPMTEALDGSEALGALLARVHESERRFGAITAALPPGLAPLLAAGPLDETGWTLLVRSGAAAAKLRQCLPTLQQALQAQGFSELPIRVKVHVARRV
jgi:hypothetical protein